MIHDDIATLLFVLLTSQFILSQGYTRNVYTSSYISRKSIQHGIFLRDIRARDMKMTTTSSSSSSSSYPLVALTREEGANDKLMALIKSPNCVEIPCLAFEQGEDTHLLADAMQKADLVAITSPTSASFFIGAWQSAGRPAVRVVTVGKGTSKPLEKEGIVPVFTPSDFTAESLASELPQSLGKTVLYPTSAIAENTLQKGLESRGFLVTRLNTYNTVPASWTTEQLETAKRVSIVTLGSPSAVKTWVERVGTDFTVAVIGPSSAKAAVSAGFRRVLCPDGSKGLEAWAELVNKELASF